MMEVNPQEAGSSARLPTGNSQRVCFIVDDDEGICHAMAFTLRKLGLEPRAVPSAAALKAAIVEQVPDLVFLDLGLGQSGAVDVLPILAEHGYRGPVQLMSGRGQEVLNEVVAAGAAQGLVMLPALVKPFRMGVVKVVVAGLSDGNAAAH